MKSSDHLEPSSAKFGFKIYLLFLWFVLLIPAQAFSLPVLSLSDGVLVDSEYPTYNFTLSTSEAQGSDTFVPISISDPAAWSSPSQVTIPAGSSNVEFGVTSLIISSSMSSGPTIALGSLSGFDTGDGTGVGSLPGYIPEVSIYGGGLTIEGTNFFWSFDLSAPQPVSSDIFIPLTLSETSLFYLNGGGVNILNGMSSSELFVYPYFPLDELSFGPEVTIGQGDGFTIGQGVAVGTVVPEPSTFLLLGAGLAGLGIVIRRRRKE